MRRRIFIKILSALLIAPATNAGVFFNGHGERSNDSQRALENGLRRPYPAPDFAAIRVWLNSRPLTMSGLRGKVVLVEFWTYGCINCVHTLPHVTAWDRKYRGKGLIIIGVHSPEFEYEKQPANVKNAVAVHQIRYPVALDNRLETWSNFNNRYWPTLYLIDRDGRVVYTHIGEGEYDVTEYNIRRLLDRKPDGAAPLNSDGRH